MGLGKKILILVSIPIAGIIAFALIVWLGMGSQTAAMNDVVENGFMPLVNQDIKLINELEGSIQLVLNADRDAYQTLMAERDALDADSPEKMEKALASDRENLDQVKDRLAKSSASFTPEMKSTYQAFQDAFGKWRELNGKVLDLAGKPETKAEGLALSRGETYAAFNAMRDIINTITEMQEKRIEETLKKIETKITAVKARSQEAGSQAAYLLTITMVVALGIIVLSGLVSWFISRSITGPIGNIVSGLRSGAGQVALSSREVKNSGQDLAQGASEQAAALEQTSSSLEEMSSMTRQNADNAAQADHMMKDSAVVVQRAGESMARLRQAMDKINNASGETAKIIKTIDEIAFQTNLLALNAAVEAARAGEAGAGFAVVAGEVRALAMRAAEAARNTANLIEENIKDIKDGSRLVVNTDETFREVQESNSRVAELVGEIAAASSEQALGIEQLNLAASQMDKVTQGVAASAEESAAAGEELDGQSQLLQNLVGDLVQVIYAGGGVKAQAAPPQVKGSGASKLKRPLPEPAGGRDRTALPAGEFKAAKTGMPAKAKDVIPFDEDEGFEDF